MTYFHDMVAAATVKPGGNVVLPPIPKFIRNGNGKKKQDCERDAAKRRVNAHKERYSTITLTILGGSLYACHSICETVYRRQE